MEENKETKTTQTKKGGSKKILIVILAIVGFVIFLCILCIAVFGFGLKKAGDKIENLDETDFQNYMEKQIEEGMRDEGQDVDVEFNKLPEDFPSDVPIYPDSEVVFASVDDASATASLMINDRSVSEDDVLSFYKKELAKNGWEVEDEATYLVSALSATKDDRELALTMLFTDDNSISYSIVVESSRY